MNKVLGYVTMGLVLAACVTINIYFPAAAAEEAARTIVRDVLRSEDRGTPEGNNPPTGDKGSFRAPLVLLSTYATVFVDRLIPAAHAQQADININTAGIQSIRASIKQRQSALAPFYESGVIGFDGNGAVTIRDLGAASLADRNRAKKLVADENRDREALYREIARANGHPEWEPDVRATFARVWVQEAPTGYWYQSGGSWQQR